jgi:two-component system sensor histidine kinase QseC
MRILGRGPEIEVQRSPALVRGEGTMLHALLRNLVENAVRHAPERGAVRVRIGAEMGHVRLDVEDSGPGVPPELRARIFDRHFRVPGSSGGAGGLGLSIAQRVAQLHGGRIEAGESADLGGLRVTVWLPQTDKDSLSRQADSGVVNPRKETAP